MKTKMQISNITKMLKQSQITNLYPNTKNISFMSKTSKKYNHHNNSLLKIPYYNISKNFNYSKSSIKCFSSEIISNDSSKYSLIDKFTEYSKFKDLENYYKKYSLTKEFLAKYKSKKVDFGFNGLGELVYRRTYSRIKLDGHNEEWYETVQRVVEGAFSMLINNIKPEHINEKQIKLDAEVMYDKIFNFKFLPPGRGLWAMGTKITEKKGLFGALNNCAFVSTKPGNKSDLNNIIKPYLFLMDCSMLGIGVGFDTKASEAGIKIFNPLDNQNTNNLFVVEDSREGWVESVGHLLLCFFSENKELPVFDYSLIRPEGTPLKTFGGTCCGYKILEHLHKDLINVFRNYLDNKGKIVNSRLVVDIMNLIGKAVVAGNIRRSAEIALGEYNDEEFVNLKNYEKNPERMNYGWVSNNSIYADIGMDYTKFAATVADNGEPGFLWLDNMKKYSRMCDDIDNKDERAMGGNPCLEQTLESYEMCCLVETFPAHHKTVKEFIDTLKYAFLYAKIVTLGMTGWKETNNIITNNRRIGVSMTGIAQFISQYGLNSLKEYCERGYEFLKSYDEDLSKKLDINPSIKITSIKPSGTVSLLGGATPGLHFPLSRFYIRRVRMRKDSPLVNELQEKGYHVEPDAYQSETTVVVSFPVDVGKGVKTIKETNLWEQLALASFMQNYWADNQVSCTVTFDKKTESNQLSSALDFYQYQLKGISFLPALDDSTPYPQMPYEEINEEEYNKILGKIKSTHFKSDLKEDQLDSEADKYCDGDKCTI